MVFRWGFGGVFGWLVCFFYFVSGGFFWFGGFFATLKESSIAGCTGYRFPVSLYLVLSFGKLHTACKHTKFRHLT